MPYNFHITRADSYLNDDKPITLEEIEEIFNDKLPDNFEINRSGMVTITTPRGEELEINQGAYLFYENIEEGGSRVNIFFNKKGAFFNIKNKLKMIPVIEFAKMIDAKVQGDEGEIYTKEELIKKFTRKAKKKKSLFKMLFRRKKKISLLKRSR